MDDTTDTGGGGVGESEGIEDLCQFPRTPHERLIEKLLAENASLREQVERLKGRSLRQAIALKRLNRSHKEALSIKTFLSGEVERLKEALETIAELTSQGDVYDIAQASLTTDKEE